MKKLSVLILFISLILSACGPTQAELDAANARTAQAEQLAAVQAQRAAEANQRADEYWWRARWSAGTNPERLAMAAMGIGLLGICMVVCYGMYTLVVDGPSRRAHDLDLRETRIREIEARAKLAQAEAAQYLAMRQGQAPQILTPEQAQWAQLAAKYGPKQLPAGRQ